MKIFNLFALQKNKAQNPILDSYYNPSMSIRNLVMLCLVLDYSCCNLNSFIITYFTHFTG